MAPGERNLAVGALLVVRRIRAFLHYHWRGLGVSLAGHLVLLALFQGGLNMVPGSPGPPDEIPVVMVEVVRTPPAPPAEEIKAEDLAESPDPEGPRLEDPPEILTFRPLSEQTLSGMDGFFHDLYCLRRLPDGRQSLRCAQVMGRMMSRRRADVARIDRLTEIARARGWAQIPALPPLEQDVIRKEGEKGAPGEDVFGPWPWE